MLCTFSNFFASVCMIKLMRNQAESLLGSFSSLAEDMFATVDCVLLLWLQFKMCVMVNGERGVVVRKGME